MSGLEPFRAFGDVGAGEIWEVEWSGRRLIVCRFYVVDVTLPPGVVFTLAPGVVCTGDNETRPNVTVREGANGAELLRMTRFDMFGGFAQVLFVAHEPPLRVVSERGLVGVRLEGYLVVP